MARPGPLLRLVHSLERRRAGRAFCVDITVRRPAARGPATTIQVSRLVGHGPRAFVVGTGDRADVLVAGGKNIDDPLASQTSEGVLPRHLALVVLPLATGPVVRVVSLHPERGFAVLPLDETPPSADAVERLPTSLGGAVVRGAGRLCFEGMLLDFVIDDGGPSEVLEVWSAGAQLAFHTPPHMRPVGDVLSSIGGPGGGGHAVPALVHVPLEIDSPLPGALHLRARDGVMRVEVGRSDVERGVLIGRSRRCVLGRGFDENDGLSRVHALVLSFEEGVWAFDLASRYGLRDVSRPGRLLTSGRLDDGIGCLVYGAGYLTWE